MSRAKQFGMNSRCWTLWLRLGFFFAILIFVNCLKAKHHLALQGARCTSRCLQEFVEIHESATTQRSDVHKSAAREPQVNKTVYDLCLSSSKCHQCLLPCSHHFSNLSGCLDFCQENLNCMFSCAYFNDIRGKKMGYCTGPTISQNAFGKTSMVKLTTNNNHPTLCLPNCKNDFSCIRNDKCCKTACGYSCYPSLIKRTWLPPLINRSKLHLEETTGETSAMLSWEEERKTKNSTVYVVQEKKFLSRVSPTRMKSPWQTLTQTPRTSIALVHLKRGFWYKFRVAAVNVNGTRGFASTDNPFKLSAEPRRPPSPIDLRRVSLRITKNAKYNVQIKWSLLENASSDLPIKGFHISWFGISHSGKPIEQTIKKRYIKASRHILSNGQKFWITWAHKLFFNIPFNISVVTSSGWSNYSLHSKQKDTQVLFPPTIHLQQVTALQVNLPFLIKNNMASVNISWNFEFAEIPEKYVIFHLEWKAIDCLTSNKLKSKKTQEIIKGRRFRLSNLVINCRYRVVVRAMYGSYRRQWSTSKQIKFVTPPCGLNEKRLISTTDRTCFNYQAFIRAPRKFEIQRLEALSSDVSVELRWRPPVTNSRRHEVASIVIGYFLYVFNNRNSDIIWISTKPKLNSRLRLKNLREDAWYSFHLAAINREGRVGQRSVGQIRTQSNKNRYRFSSRFHPEFQN